MPTRPSQSAAAAENSPENLASSPLRGFEWMRIRGTDAPTPTVTCSTCSGAMAWMRLSSSALSMIECVQAQDG